MPRYLFNAQSRNGEQISGFRQGINAGAIAAELSASGMLPLKIELAEAEAIDKGSARFVLFKPSVKINELIVFSHQMATLSKAGISVVRAVRSLAESSKNEYLAEVLFDVAANLEAGVDIASSLGRHPRVFGELYCSYPCG